MIQFGHQGAHTCEFALLGRSAKEVLKMAEVGQVKARESDRKFQRSEKLMVT